MDFDYAFDEERGIDTVDSPELALAVRRLGAEAIGLTRRHPELGEVGLLWRNGRTDPPAKYWKSHAPILFPAVGGIKDNRSQTTDGTSIRFNRLHGFARERVFTLIEAAEGGASFTLHYHLEDDQETRAMYPWRFALDVFYRLHADRLEQTMTVTNRDERPMPFQIGWHPGFNAPQIAGEKADCRLVLPEGTAIRKGNNADCRLTGADEEIELAGHFATTEAALDATYMFDFSATPPERRVASLTDPDGRIGVRLAFPDYPHLGLWSDAGAPFVCIEPWQGMDDSEPPVPFDEKFGVVILPPGESDTRRAWIEVIG